MKKWMAIFIVAALSFTACNKNTVPGDTTPIAQVISGQQYIFKAETANPMGGSTVRLSHGFDLVIKPNEVIATLPYYGRAYTAERNFSGIRFHSSRFQYVATANEKGSWEVVIQPDDAEGIQELRLSITEDGYATLYVTSTNRQAISYYGRVEKT